MLFGGSEGLIVSQAAGRVPRKAAAAVTTKRRRERRRRSPGR